MANPPRKASGSNKQKEMATKPTSPQSKKRVSVGAQTSTKGKTATKSPAKCSRAGTRSTRNISTVETQSTHVDPVLETSLQAVPSIGTSESNAISLADLSREMVQAAQEKGIAVPRMSEIEAEYKKRQANQGAANPQVTHLLPTSVSVALTHIPCSLAIISSTCTTVTASYGQPICSTGITNQSVTSPLRNTPLDITLPSAYTSPIEDIGDVTNVTQQETRRVDNQQDCLVTVLRTKLVNVEKELRHERERCAILERSCNRKVAELFTKEQQRMGKQVSPLLTLDVVNGAHKRIPLKQREELQQVPRRGNQGTVTKNKENTKTRTIHGTQRRLKQDYKRH